MLTSSSHFTQELLNSLPPAERQQYQMVFDALKNNELLTDRLRIDDDNDYTNRTLGERMADGVARFGGSWAFIGWFAAVMVCWMCLNAYFLHNRGFDPYPFILLNLALSCLAAIQAPIIMMSQNRKEKRDRDRAQDDYLINLKAEIEVRILHQKLEDLTASQNRLFEGTQQEQKELLANLNQTLKIVQTSVDALCKHLNLPEEKKADKDS